MRSFNLEELKLLTKLPDERQVEWLLDAESSVAILHVNAQNDEIVIYAHTQSVLIHGVLALKRKITPTAVSELQHRNMPMPDDSWRIQKAWGGGKGHRMYLEPPLTYVHRSLEEGEKLVFLRSFSGVDKGSARIELNQKLVHSLDLYFVPERNAYCRLDLRGDIEDVIKIYEIDRENSENFICAVSILRRDLDRFMALSKTCLVLRFDFTRLRWGSFNGWGNVNTYERDKTDLCYHGGISEEGSYCNGVMVIRPSVTVADLVREWKAEENPSKRKYATFKIYDRKNSVNVETSCAPQFLSNYFKKSDLPWEISPAFFRPEVLHRFKADPEKYTLKDRSISCRNAWHLKTYDINEAGQVHTYIGYLADLPYKEQLYWQSFNEWPKGPISPRAHQTDIMGDWYLEHEPLSAIKHTISLLDANPPSWWKPRGSDIEEAVHYPATDSVKEWADEILSLDQYVIEGLLLKPLQDLAQSGGSTVDQKWGTLRVLQEVLIASGQSESAAKDVVSPLQRLHTLRTVVRGHAAVEKRRAAASSARAHFGTLRAHFQHLVVDCEQALNTILKSLGIV